MLSYYFNYYKRKIKSVDQKRNQQFKTESYPQIGLVNPSIGTANLGDLIIYDAVYRHLRAIFPTSFLVSFPSHFHTSYDAKLKMAANDYLFVGGTNLLSSEMNNYYQWKLDPSDQFYLRNKNILMGVGWWQYQEKPNKYTARLLKTVLSADRMHSVRDGYTKGMLNQIGIGNVVNTACPTMWDLSPEHCAGIKKEKAKSVVTTLTYYNANEQDDRMLLETLSGKYEEVFLWIQGIDDLSYLKTIYPDYHKIKLIAPTLEAYDEVLQNPDIEYVGTRLHAGIRALQKKRRTLILAVDNRAIEIGKDTNLNVIPRKEIRESGFFIDHSYTTEIRLPVKEIHLWKSQFNKF
jgi:polysaccharide pyruvyl transferase WcaK-like protein